MQSAISNVLCLSFAMLLLLLLGAGSATAEVTPSDERGLSSDTAYQMGNVDHVNLFSGNLTVTLPLGKGYPLGPSSSYGLTLVYNSNGWVQTEEICGNGGGGGTDYALVQPDPRNNAGFGWRVNLGQLFPPSTPPHNADLMRWLFITPDGGEHLFVDELHPGYPATPQAGVTFSTDSTYLRMKTSGCSTTPAGTSGCRKIESPDGSVHEFHRYGTGSLDWKLTTYSDVHGNDLTVTYSGGDWTLTDEHGRVHTVDFDVTGKISEVVMEGIDGADVVYDLIYGQPVDIERQRYGFPGTNCIPAAPGNLVSVHTLDRLVMPDGSFYEFTYFDNDTDDVLSGGMASLRLPTGGEIRYTYRRDFYLNEEPFPDQSPIRAADGVGTRSLFEDPISATATGTWTYDLVTGDNPDSPFFTGPGQAPPCFHTRVVTDPEGNAVEHFFSTVRLEKGWAYGLPLSICDPDNATGVEVPSPWVSQRLYEGDVATGTLMREIQVDYTADGNAPNSIDVQGWNTRMTKRIEIYKDDDDNTRETTYSGFDGIGHWRTTTASGSFGPTKTATTDWNDGLGTLTTNPDATTASGFTMPSAATGWIWGFYTEQSVTQDSGTTKTEAAFDSSTGALLRQRTLAGTTRANHDVVTVVERNASGFVTTEKKWGGDDNSVTFDNVYDALADMDLPAADTEEYRVVHTYSAGVAETSKYVNPCDEAEVYLTVFDQDVDAKSGLPTAVRDASGFVTSLVYDENLRLLREEAQEGAWMTYSYQLPTTSNTSLTPTYQIKACKSGFTDDPCLSANTLASEFNEYDGLGRRVRYATSVPKQGNPTASEDRAFTYNALGWLLEETTWGQQKSTTYSGHDRFGRPGLIIPPGQPAIALAYTGERITGRRSQVLTLSGSQQACHQERFDHFGRLTVVRENFTESLDDCLRVSGDLTSYIYDEMDRLTAVCQNKVGTVCGQDRTFQYDGRGVLTSEVQPEIGPSGNGTVSYSYDSMGSVLSRDIAGSDNHSLRYQYDGAGRLTHVRQVVDGGNTRLLKEFRYARDNSLGWSLGKLVESVRWNWLTLSVPPLETFDEPGNSPVQVTTRYEYGGTAGRISKKITSQRAGGASTAFRSSFSYDQLGNLVTLTYPQCLTGECDDSAPARTVSFGYSRGHLTSVTGYAPNIWYQEGGMLDTIEYTNGVSWSQSVSATSDLARPHEIMITGTSDGTDSNSGQFSYDGSGNITAVGALDYRYDLLNRLTSGEARAGTAGIQTQTTSFDAYGNITSMTTAGQTRTLTTNVSTNRLSGAGMSYDEAGNLTTAAVDGFNFEYTYDGLNAMKFYQSQSESKVFSYDADGERLETFRCPGNVCGEGEGNERFTLRGLNGEVLRIYEGETGNRGWVEDYVYANGRPLARVRADAGGEVVEYLHLDHLGSARKVTNELAEEVTKHEYYPFGEETTAPSGGDTKLKFTGHERDDGSGSSDELDYMHARFCGPRLGRFLSVDPRGAALGDPSSLNRYAYARNNPLVFVDPTGEVISLANLSDDEIETLLEDLNAFTGNTYDVENGNLVLVATGSDSSQIATDYLNDLIGSGTVYGVESTEGTNARIPGTNDVEINFNLGALTEYNRVDPRTLNTGSALVHELYHITSGLYDTKDGTKLGTRSTEPDWTGPVVDFVNTIRAERGLPVRAAYPTQPTGRGWKKARIHFKAVDAKHPERRRYVFRPRTDGRYRVGPSGQYRKN